MSNLATCKNEYTTHSPRFKPWAMNMQVKDLLLTTMKRDGRVGTREIFED
jgi:hypothetical protein